MMPNGKEWSGVKYHFSLRASTKLKKPNQVEMDTIQEIYTNVKDNKQ